jgi:predicted dehydrogenase
MKGGACVAPIRVGVVGLGLITQAVHLPNLQTLRGDFLVTSVCDASSGLAISVADALPGQVAATDDWREVVDDPRVDAVLVLTPGAHGDVVLGAMRAGKHVFAEKPLGHSQAEIAEMIALAQETGLVLQVGTMKAHDDIIGPARRALGRIGTVRVVRITVLHPTDECQFEHVNLLPAASPNPEVIAAGRAYTHARNDEAVSDSAPGVRRLYADVLLGSVVHELALLRALGLDLPLSWDFASVDPPLQEVTPAEPPRIMAIGGLPAGGQMQLSWNWVPDYPEYDEEVKVIGSAGRVTLMMPGPYLADHRARLVVESMSEGVRSRSEMFSGNTTAFVRELQSFAASIRFGAPVLCDASGALADIRCLQALASAAGRQAGLHVAGEAA